MKYQKIKEHVGLALAGIDQKRAKEGDAARYRLLCESYDRLKAAYLDLAAVIVDRYKEGA